MELTTRTLLTERDHAILRAVENHKFLRSSQIADLAGGSRQQVLRRLQKLFHIGELDRPRSQVDYYRQGGGSRELVYGLPGRQVQRFYLEHALMTSDIAFTIDRACRQPENHRLQLIQENEIARELGKGKAVQGDPFQWYVDITRHLRVGVRPDRVLQVALRDSIFPESERATFFIEADRGTMPITRSGLEQTSILRKLLAYQSTWAQGLHRSILNIDRFRVLIVTSDQVRAKHMIEACQRIERGRRLFLFAVHETVIDAQNIFKIPLINGRGEPDSLLESAALRFSETSLENARVSELHFQPNN